MSFVHAEYTVRLNGIPIRTDDDGKIEVRVRPVIDQAYGNGMWDVEFMGADDKWHPAPGDLHKQILSQIEAESPSAYAEMEQEALESYLEGVG